MDYYIDRIEKLQDEFHETMEKYPLFGEMIDEIYDKDVKEINDLLEKNDEESLKGAVNKLETLIEYIQNTSTNIKKAYEAFDLMAKEWDQLDLSNLNEKNVQSLNEKVSLAGKLIMEHDIKSIMEANKMLSDVLNAVK